ncbi:unnamed protein product [Allacma fusca]|nr:unnamed protein product [Allacma fusca]
MAQFFMRSNFKFVLTIRTSSRFGFSKDRKSWPPTNESSNGGGKTKSRALATALFSLQDIGDIAKGLEGQGLEFKKR